MIITTSVGDFFDPAVLDQIEATLVDQFTWDLADMARAKWLQLAQAGLSTTRRDYVNGIQATDKVPGSATVTLLGVLPNIIENGMDAIDMHDTLLGPNVPVVPRGKRGKHAKKGGGYYRSIPFRHATPGTSGAVGAAMGSQYEGHAALGGAGFMPLGGRTAIQTAQALGKRIYGAAKKLTPTTGMPGGPVNYGSRLPAGLAPKLRPHHATDIYAGMIRQQKTYQNATQNQYTTFRTISTGSPGWLRAATPGRHFASEVNQHVAAMAPKALETFLSQLGMGT